MIKAKCLLQRVVRVTTLDVWKVAAFCAYTLLLCTCESINIFSPGITAWKWLVELT